MECDWEIIAFSLAFKTGWIVVQKKLTLKEFENHQVNVCKSQY